VSEDGERAALMEACSTPHQQESPSGDD
jgi:hypothetical protein